MVPPQGTIKLAQNKLFPQTTAAMWMDRNPVHFLSSGGSCQPGIVMRHIHGEMKPLPAPELRYSVQLGYKSRKYYRTLFLGLLDMALVNAFIVHRHNRQVNGQCPPRHFVFFEELMEQLLAVDSAEAFAEIEEATCARERTAPSPARTGPTTPQESTAAGAFADVDHRLEENPDIVEGEQGVKQRHRSCKVCAVYNVKPRKYTKKCICNVPREERTSTCFDIWHSDWNNGNAIPANLQQAHKTGVRPPPSRPDKKRRRRANRPPGPGNGGAGNDEGEAEDDASNAGEGVSIAEG
ncbi:hypothetical protein PC110_g7472 [Phytophthora cactorum]|uniref:PiggyBac transposable element-derived protein domain-containing protein n=1 Tax=Phytophthora cactorum TaxID=29920 RepID=A0A329SI69_9STRA|nr:hypothetical protein PC110_g7472 [Phytophthora cactorum]